RTAYRHVSGHRRLDGARGAARRGARPRSDHQVLFRHAPTDCRLRRGGPHLRRRRGNRYVAAERGSRAQRPITALLLRRRRKDDRTRSVVCPGIRRRAAVPRRYSCGSRRRQRVRRHEAADRVFRRYDERRCPALRALQGRRRNPGRLGRHVAQRCSPAWAEQGVWPKALWHALEESGLTLTWVPDELGGAGAALADGFAVLRAAGRFAAPVPLAETLMAGWLLTQAGISVPGGPLTIAPIHADGRIALTADGALSGRARRVPFARHA